jgi:hypothetical protein
MDVFVFPIGSSRYALYCEPSPEAEDGGDPAAPSSLLDRLKHRFGVMLRAAEERQHARGRASEEPRTSMGRLQDRVLTWVVERIAEQRLLWHLRRQRTAVAVHPRASAGPDLRAGDDARAAHPAA